MQAEASDVAPRGVYKALYFVKGKAVLVAIDSKGDARKHLKIERGDDEPKLKRALEEFLDMVDPLPGPRLPAVTPRGTIAEPLPGDSEHKKWEHAGSYRRRVDDTASEGVF
jgi:hypothetical protein